MDPRDRERAERRLIASLPGPEVPPQPLDPDTERRLAWFVKNRKQIQEDMQLEIDITPMGIEAFPLRTVTPALTITR